MSITPIPADNAPLDPKTGRLKAPWFSFLSSVASSTKVYTVATLPTSAKPGMILHTSDGRKPSEGAGHGSGMLVFFDGANWISVSSGAEVTS